MKNTISFFTIVCAFAILASCNKDDNKSTDVSSTDAAFTPMAAMSNYAEISAGELALTKSADTAVLAFANRMISDHTHAQDSLKLIASQLNLSALDTLNPEQAAVAAQLKTLSGRAFDSVYVSSEVTGHIKTIALLNGETTNGTNTKLKTYVSTYLPAVTMHLDMADSLAAKY